MNSLRKQSPTGKETKELTNSLQSTSETSADQPCVRKTKQSRLSSSLDFEDVHAFNEKKIFVGGIKKTLLKREFLSYFEEFGAIKGIEVLRKKKSLLRRGFCFLIYEEKAVVDKILKQGVHVICGVEVECKVACPKEKATGEKVSQPVSFEGYETSLARLSLAMQVRGTDLNKEFYKFMTRGDRNVCVEFSDTIKFLNLESKRMFVWKRLFDNK